MTTVERSIRYERALAGAPPELRALLTALVLRERARTATASVTPPAEPTADRPAEPPRSYSDLVEHVTATVSGLAEPGATVLVVSRGDPALLAVSPARACHFPQGADGGFAGYYPRDAADALAQLDELREAGAAYLVFPATSAWWLDHYGPLASHLLTHARVAHHDPDCLVFDLRTERSSHPS